MPDGEEEEQDRERNVNEQPAVQPVLQLRLEIELAPFVAPRLELLHLVLPLDADADLEEAELVIRHAL